MREVMRVGVEMALGGFQSAEFCSYHKIHKILQFYDNLELLECDPYYMLNLELLECDPYYMHIFKIPYYIQIIYSYFNLYCTGLSGLDPVSRNTMTAVLAGSVVFIRFPLSASFLSASGSD
ncbi:hypothetical protein STAS_14903 [Striga asiatica]|uniref:Uncharacterized protein n=1 Tax=Striga asiatica TaxID=4170 RepID=A0A5A7Q0I2_STRAF|nr:hypothetical protein STAS_14903 [Striga asiatica]